MKIFQILVHTNHNESFHIKFHSAHNENDSVNRHIAHLKTTEPYVTAHNYNNWETGTNLEKITFWHQDMTEHLKRVIPSLLDCYETKKVYHTIKLTKNDFMKLQSVLLTQINTCDCAAYNTLCCHCTLCQVILDQ
jgi:hypothetical protein